ncbi:hypothetical protein BG60_24695 [Caballeronia zhejiangensis]|uniref:Uncharacterized protein n=1 Tax=Caballeronia zhejiangensis TaxID=871203 RepID=A0A656QLJ3_9BURK|nr:hypothetical protein BG60_24695 [Caballeronia zhejiangensis]
MRPKKSISHALVPSSRLVDFVVTPDWCDALCVPVAVIDGPSSARTIRYSASYCATFSAACRKSRLFVSASSIN